MLKQDLIELSPVRIFDEASKGGLKEGSMGLITAKKGLGKTAVLVQFGIDSLLKDKHVVHVSFDQHSSNVIAWYDSILSEMAKKKHVNISDLSDDIVSERTILNFNQNTFTLPKVVTTIKALKEGGINIAAIVIDGLDLNETSKADLEVMASFVKSENMTAWFSFTTEEETLDQTLECGKLELFDFVCHLAASEKDICMTLLKPEGSKILLDSKTLLMTKI